MDNKQAENGYQNIGYTNNTKKIVKIGFVGNTIHYEGNWAQVKMEKEHLQLQHSLILHASRFYLNGTLQ